jgi:hypothetical protein
MSLSIILRFQNVHAPVYTEQDGGSLLMLVQGAFLRRLE